MNDFDPPTFFDSDHSRDGFGPKLFTADYGHPIIREERRRIALDERELVRQVGKQPQTWAGGTELRQNGYVRLGPANAIGQHGDA